MAFKPCIVFTVLNLALTLTLTHAQNSPQDYLDAHNSARAALGIADLEWSDEVAAYAQNYANQRIGDCARQHSDSGGQYGENIAWWSDDSFTAAKAVQMWLDEEVDYDYDSNTCGAQSPIARDIECGHYTQVVWRNSVSLGCARVICSTGETYITCNYSPPGNVIGEKPY